ncbi:hypothetical protein AB0M43_21560 [Longispora sp. NPDC051575]|uniref:hypothetical protein n=1 Tax=Longispora sp. NPDC051575 TaxID=3154943 RepID=UPI00341C1547
MAFGLLGWFAAHLATFWLLEHDHPGVERHAHGYLPSMTVLAGCLAAGSLLAVFLVSLSAPAARRGGLPGTGALAWLSSGLSTGAFVAAEFAEGWVSGEHAVPQPVVLAVGGVVHLLVGAGASLVWRVCAAGVLRLAARLRREPAAAVEDGPAGVFGEAAVACRRRGVSLFAGRAPPAVWL